MALHSQFTGRLKDQESKFPEINGARLAESHVLFKDRNQIGGSLARASDCVCKHIVAFNDGGDYFPLNHGRVLIVQLRTSFGNCLAYE